MLRLISRDSCLILTTPAHLSRSICLFAPKENPANTGDHQRCSVHSQQTGRQTKRVSDLLPVHLLRRRLTFPRRLARAASPDLAQGLPASASAPRPPSAPGAAVRPAPPARGCPTRSQGSRRRKSTGCAAGGHPRTRAPQRRERPTLSPKRPPGFVRIQRGCLSYSEDSMPIPTDGKALMPTPAQRNEIFTGNRKRVLTVC